MKLPLLTSATYFFTSTAAALVPHNWQPIPIAIGFCAVILIVGLDSNKEPK